MNLSQQSAWGSPSLLRGVSPLQRGRGGRAVLGVVLLAYWAAFLVAGSEQWHHDLHERGSGDAHQCFATLLQGGHAEPVDPALAVPEAPRACASRIGLASQTSVSPHLRLLPEGRGPPL